MLAGRQLEAFFEVLGQLEGVALIGTRAAHRAPRRLPPLQVGGAGGRPPPRRRDGQRRTGLIGERGRDELRCGHQASFFPETRWSRAYTIDADSASQEAAMMFSDTPIVVHVSSPSDESISTRV